MSIKYLYSQGIYITFCIRGTVALGRSSSSSPGCPGQPHCPVHAALQRASGIVLENRENIPIAQATSRAAKVLFLRPVMVKGAVSQKSLFPLLPRVAALLYSGLRMQLLVHTAAVPQQWPPRTFNWGLPFKILEHPLVQGRGGISCSQWVWFAALSALSGSVVGQPGKDLDNSPTALLREMPLSTSYLLTYLSVCLFKDLVL